MGVTLTVRMRLNDGHIDARLATVEAVEGRLQDGAVGGVFAASLVGRG